MTTVISSTIQVLSLDSASLPGQVNMALDAKLLDYICEKKADANEQPILIVRTYGWSEPTLSLGVNQPDKDVEQLLQSDLLAGIHDVSKLPIVRRPTGGRAILHGDDYSYSIATNWPVLTKQSIKNSYCMMGKWVQSALQDLGVPATPQSNPLQAPRKAAVAASSESCQSSVAAYPQTLSTIAEYTRSPVCFETRMPDDLVVTDPDAAISHKISGSAQCRRSGCLMQHGSLFIQDFGIDLPTFTAQLFSTIAKALEVDIQPFDLNPLN